MDIYVIGSKAKNKQEIVNQLFLLLLNKGYVKKTYEEAIHKREEEFPTGLELEGNFNVAIPHAETDHVNKEAIALGILDEPIFWESMEDPENTLSVHLIFLLAIKDPQMVVPNLKALTDNVFSKPEIVAKIKNSTNSKDTIRLLKELLNY